MEDFISKSSILRSVPDVGFSIFIMEKRENTRPKEDSIIFTRQIN